MRCHIGHIDVSKNSWSVRLAPFETNIAMQMRLTIQQIMLCSLIAVILAAGACGGNPPPEVEPTPPPVPAAPPPSLVPLRLQHQTGLGPRKIRDRAAGGDREARLLAEERRARGRHRQTREL